MVNSRLEQQYQKWQSYELSDAQMALCFFLECYHELAPTRRLQEYLEAGEIDEKALQLFQFKKIKQKAIDCLERWCCGDWELHLTDKILSPYKVLNLQAQGIRPVTMKMTDRLDPVLHREHALDFLCHDLEHGYMFFHDSNLKRMQIDFFAQIEKTLDDGLWENYLKDENFKQKFIYLISDMNSHQEHYKSYLFSLLPQNDLAQFNFLFEQAGRE